MFKVDKDAIGRYHISIGVGKIYSTKDIEEVKTALNHYYGGKNSCSLGSNPKCPLCRAINEEVKHKQEGASGNKIKGGSND